MAFHWSVSWEDGCDSLEYTRCSVQHFSIPRWEALYDFWPWWMGRRIAFRFCPQAAAVHSSCYFCLYLCCYYWTLSTAWRMHTHTSYLTIWVMRHLWASFILRSSSTKLHHGAFSQLFVNEKTSFMYIGSFKCSSVSPWREYNAETVNNRRKLNQSKLPPRLQLSNMSCFVFWFLSSFLFATFLWDKGPNNHLPIMVNLDNGHLKLDSPSFLFFDFHVFRDLFYSRVTSDPLQS